MRIFKLIGVLVCALAVSAVAITTASASILPGATGTSITGGSEKATLQVKGGASITCPKSTATGEITGETPSTASVSITFGPKCTTAGLPINSLGAAAGIIVANVTVKECASNPGILELETAPLHLEVPSTKLLLAVLGVALGEIEPGVKQTTYALSLTQKEGKNTVETCGKEKLVLSTSTDGSPTFIQSGEEAKSAKLTFGAEEEFM
jgi:hypothetical protein